MTANVAKLLDQKHQVRESAKFIAENSKDVTIDASAIVEAADWV